jgi:tetraacyldisaccharide 4'-kinase
MLREPLCSIKRAQIAVVMNSDKTEVRKIEEAIRRYNPEIKFFLARFKPECFLDIKGESLALKDFKGKKATLFCGIAYPQAFLETVRGIDIKTENILRFADHHIYTQKDLNRIIKKASQTNSVIVTTQKDMVKIKTFKSLPRVFALKISIEVETEDSLISEITDYIKKVGDS